MSLIQRLSQISGGLALVMTGFVTLTACQAHNPADPNFAPAAAQTPQTPPAQSESPNAPIVTATPAPNTNPQPPYDDRDHLSLGPAQVIIIRHGEKPDEGDDLNDRGRQRAQALVGFFKTNPAVLRYGTPAAIYAAAPNEADRSNRMIETVTPLAESLGMTVLTTFTKDQIDQAAKAILNNPAYAGKMVLLCWEHKRIPDLARAFGLQDAPGWPGEQFDRAWILDYKDGHLANFTDLPEHVLPGDSDH